MKLLAPHKILFGKVTVAVLLSSSAFMPLTAMEGEGSRSDLDNARRAVVQGTGLSADDANAVVGKGSVKGARAKFDKASPEKPEDFIKRNFKLRTEELTERAEEERRIAEAAKLQAEEAQHLRVIAEQKAEEEQLKAVDAGSKAAAAQQETEKEKQQRLLAQAQAEEAEHRAQESTVAARAAAMQAEEAQAKHMKLVSSMGDVLQIVQGDAESAKKVVAVAEECLKDLERARDGYKKEWGTFSYGGKGYLNIGEEGVRYYILKNTLIPNAEKDVATALLGLEQMKKNALENQATVDLTHKLLERMRERGVAIATTLASAQASGSASAELQSSASESSASADGQV